MAVFCKKQPIFSCLVSHEHGSTAQHSTAQHSTAQHSTAAVMTMAAQHSTAHHPIGHGHMFSNTATNRLHPDGHMQQTPQRREQVCNAT